MKISDFLIDFALIACAAFIFFMWYLFLVKFKAHRKRGVSDITPFESKYIATRFLPGVAVLIAIIVVAQMLKNRGL